MRKRNKAQPLDLYMNGEYVGQWQQTAAGDALRYADSWRTSANSRPLSIRFPLTPDEQPYVGAEVRRYFDNLLPDTNAIRERIAHRFNVSAIDAYSMLEALGRDCVGALQILPEGVEPPKVQSIAGRALTEADVAMLLRTTVAPNLADDTREHFRLSLAGAQEKTALLWHKSKWMQPLGATPTTHIFKLPLGLVGNMRADMRASVENEWLCAKIVAAYGLPIANCEMAMFEDQKVLIVERFDRRLSSDAHWIMRLPQEDLCQATGTSYLNKYQTDGGPGIDQIMNLLRTAERPFDDRRVFFACQIVFWLLGATDGHAKNFSIRIGAGGTYSLTPLYDVLSVYPVLGTKSGEIAPQKAALAMGVRGDKNMHYRLNEILRRHWNTSARRNGLIDSFEPIIDELIARTPGVIDIVKAQIPRGFPAHVASSIFSGLQNAANKLAKQRAVPGLHDTEALGLGSRTLQVRRPQQGA